MSPITHRIQSFRAVRQKYTRLRDRAISERNSSVADHTAGWVLDHKELKATLQGIEEGAVWRSIESSEWCTSDADWETVVAGSDSVATDTCGGWAYEAGQKDETESTVTAAEVLESYVKQSEDEMVKMDWKSTFKGSFEGGNKENEDVADAALGEAVELRDLLQLEKDQPDNFFNLEAPTRPTSPKHDKVPSNTDRLSADFEYFDWDDKDIDDDDDDFLDTDFFRTEAAISDAEWALETLMPFRRYRAKTPSYLRACYTVRIHE
ncbi:hypothetical protein N431DRAFT_504050 [Stipitochalara longipes BDJ]|nr:hypothetical protein N431DRAFT_504050 [Stipitochalara longipes BDJ]